MYGRQFSSVKKLDLQKHYHIEASNAERDDATKLTVQGPDVDGKIADGVMTIQIPAVPLTIGV